MKFILIFISCFSISVLLKAQELSVQETLSYINKQLNDRDNKIKELYVHTFIPKDQVTVSNISRVAMTDYSYEVKIQHGYLIVNQTYLKGRNKVIVEEASVPIKDIDQEYDYNSPYFNFLCNHKPEAVFGLFVKKMYKSVTKISKEFDYDSGKELYKKTDKLDAIQISFSNDNLICDKIRNAFLHLIKLTINDPNYNTIDITLEKDPFETTIPEDILKSKETVIPNNIITGKTNSIPMIKNGGVYEIPVIINGVLKLNFIFDSGASDVSVSPDVALTLIRTGTISDEDFRGTQIYKFADGSTAKSKIFIIKEFQLGNKKVYNIKASISNSVNAPLLLGQSVLNKFGKVSIDYTNSVIILEN